MSNSGQLAGIQHIKDLKAASFLEALDDAGFVLANTLLKSAHLPLRTYLAGLIPIATEQNTYLGYFLEALAEFLHFYEEIDIDEICSAVQHRPVMQQADHSGLLFDEEVLMNNLLFSLASREVGAEVMLTSQCSTMSCISHRSPMSGTVILHTRNSIFKVFSNSNRSFEKSSFCALPGPLTLAMKPIDGYASISPEDDFLLQFVGREFASAPAAYKLCNDQIWKELNLDVMVRRVGVDEFMTSLLLIRHLRDTASPVYQLLFNPRICDAFIDTKRQFVASSANRAINKSAPDFFWFKKGNRLYPMHSHGDVDHCRYVVDDGRSMSHITLSPASLISYLREGVIYTDKVLAYFMRCLLPGVVAVGGTSQQDYVSHYRDIFLQTNSREPFLTSSDIQRISRLDLSRLGGKPLVELTVDQREMVSFLDKKTDLMNLTNSFLDLPIGETIGTLKCAQYLADNLTPSPSMASS